MAAIVVYKIPQVISVTLPGAIAGEELMNYPVNRTDFQIVKHLQNEIEVLVRDIDRKPVNLTGQSVTCNVVDRREQKLILSAPLTVIDAAKGRARIVVPLADTVELPLGQFAYALVLTRADGAEIGLCTDRGRTPDGWLSIVDGPLPRPVEAIEMRPSEFLVVDDIKVGGAYPGAANGGNDHGLHTVAAYLDGFTGTIELQASLENQPSASDGDWFTATTKTYAAGDGVQAFTVEGKFLWVRFRVATVAGTVEKILYRN